jgi:hypothetical protein
MTTIEPIARAGAAITSVLGSGTENDPMYEPSLMSSVVGLVWVSVPMIVTLPMASKISPFRP